MRCPFCGHGDTQVKDSRPTEENAFKITLAERTLAAMLKEA